MYNNIYYISNNINNIGANAAKNFNSLNAFNKYPHLFYPIPGTRNENPKGMCLCCLKEQSCENYKSDDEKVNYKNLFSHIANQHSTMLLPEDVKKYGQDDSKTKGYQALQKRKLDPFVITSMNASKRIAIDDLRDLTKVLRDETSALCADAFVPFSLVENPAYQLSVGRIIDKVTGRTNKIRWPKRKALTNQVKRYVNKSVGNVIEAFREQLKATSQGTDNAKAWFATDGTSNKRNHYIAINSGRIVPRDLVEKGKTTFVLEEHYLKCSVDNERQNQVQAFFFFVKSVEEILDE